MAAIIFAFSSVPSLGTGLGTWDLVLRKLAHLTEYARARRLSSSGRSPGPGSRSSIGGLYAAPTRSTSISSAGVTPPGTTW